jgi:outer membrane lipase/esterase
MKKTYRLLAGVALVSVTFASHQTNAAYSQMISFGDSLSDTGNRYAASQDSGAITSEYPNGTQVDQPYYQGRYSSGILWNEVLANNLTAAGALNGGVPTPSYNGGTNYAWGGARVIVDTTYAGLFRPSVSSQVSSYLAANGGVADPNAIFTLTGGGNDLSAVISQEATVADVQAAATGLVSAAEALVAAGANSVIVSNVPDLGKAPIAVGNEFLASFLTGVSFNGLLTSNGLGTQDEIHLFDAFGLHQVIDANPGDWGITSTRGDCFSDAGVSNGDATPNCDGYVFTDDRHPSALGNQIFGDYVTSAALAMAPTTVVPVPAALPLFASALVGIGFFRRKALES